MESLPPSRRGSLSPASNFFLPLPPTGFRSPRPRFSGTSPGDPAHRPSGLGAARSTRPPRPSRGARPAPEPDTHFRRLGLGRNRGERRGGGNPGSGGAGPPDPEPCPACAGRTCARGHAASPLVQVRPPACPVAFPETCVRPRPASRIFDPISLIHEFLRGRILQRHPEGGISNQLPH